jgi:hypothetical protein
VVKRWLLILTLGLTAPAPPVGALERLPAALHVHSNLSTGDFSLDDLAKMAERQGIEALLITENYLLRIQYGLPPFRALTQVSYEERGVLGSGLHNYLASIADARRKHPRLLFIPGVEVIPHFYWTASPRVLMLHNIQKNLLVFGITDPEALAALPAIGNPRSRRYTWQSVVDAVPVALLIPGLALMLRKRPRRHRIAGTVVVIRRRAWLAGTVLVAVGLIALARGWPFTVDRYSPWRDHGVAPYQALIDHVERLGGSVVWSFPEASDLGERAVGPLQVKWRTDPYPDDLLRTARYSAFGGLYEQTVRVVEPGGMWDRLLSQYAAGERSRPAWAVGESGFHGMGAGKRVGTVQTVFLVEQRSEAGVLDALRRGRLYALQRTTEAELALVDFSIVTPGGTARPGETLRVQPGTPLEIRIALGAGGAAALPVRLSLVRNGTVAEAWAGQTPFETVRRESAEGRPAVYRLDVRSTAPHRLLTSPIFIMVDS